MIANDSILNLTKPDIWAMYANVRMYTEIYGENVTKRNFEPGQCMVEVCENLRMKTVINSTFGPGLIVRYCGSATRQNKVFGMVG